MSSRILHLGLAITHSRITWLLQWFVSWIFPAGRFEWRWASRLLNFHFGYQEEFGRRNYRVTFQILQNTPWFCCSHWHLSPEMPARNPLHSDTIPGTPYTMFVIRKNPNICYERCFFSISPPIVPINTPYATQERTFLLWNISVTSVQFCTAMLLRAVRAIRQHLPSCQWSHCLG